ncbi:MAG: imidazole glycerol phosphate synthase subunit HisH [Lentisphaeria bacterium]|jgi:glutamine amidotransferase
MIAIVDYRAGNLTSVQRALAALGHAALVTAEPQAIAAAERIIFPGVGAAGEAMRHLGELKLAPALRAAVAAGKPFLGICLGYQILFEWSAEDGGVECLGLLPGRVVRFPEPLRSPHQERPLKIPHMGWNAARPLQSHPVLAGIPAESEFYFVHSYHPTAVPAAAALTATDYGLEFTSGAAAGALVGFQFHPEKSGRPGLRLLANFCAWNPQP